MFELVARLFLEMDYIRIVIDGLMRKVCFCLEMSLKKFLKLKKIKLINEKARAAHKLEVGSCMVSISTYVDQANQQHLKTHIQLTCCSGFCPKI
jgi:hypothetical protein